VGVGGGYIRHVLNISDAESDSRPLVDKATSDAYLHGPNGMLVDPYANPNNKPQINEVCLNRHDNCWDNISMGYVLISVGGSLYYDLVRFQNGGFGVIGDLALIAGFGDQFGLNLDVSVGIGAHFL
jgi:hypothetical protein